MKTVISFFLLAGIVCGQSNQGKTESKEIPLSFSTFFNPQTILWESPLEKEFGLMDLNTSFLNDSSSVMLGTRMQLSSFYNKPFEDSRNSLLNPLYQSYMDSQKNKWVKQVLGAVQMGAVGFLAYKHISKYGLFKKKDD